MSWWALWPRVVLGVLGLALAGGACCARTRPATPWPASAA